MVDTYRVYVEEIVTYVFELKAQDEQDAIWNGEEIYKRDDFDPDTMCLVYFTKKSDGLVTTANKVY
jgi:hypothetical protein